MFKTLMRGVAAAAKEQLTDNGALLIPFASIEIWIKAYFAMGAALLVQAGIVVTKTLRDVHEGGKLVSRIKDAKAERLLMEIERGK